MTKVTLDQEPNEVCDWFKQYIDIPSNTVLIEFSDGTSKRVKRGEYLANVENDLRRMMQVQIERESYEDALRCGYEKRWIPVSERLPEDGEIVIASVDGEYVYSEARYSKEYGWEWAAESSYDYWADLDGVDAWMPLPKAYKPESEEEDD